MKKILAATPVTRFSIFALLLSFIFFTATFCNSPSPKKEVTKPVTYASLSDTVKYVGITTCRRCHESVYETFVQTGMGKSFDIASHKKSSAKFDSHALIYDKYKDFYYKPFWKNDSLYVLEYRLENRDTVFKRIEHVSYIVGSGQHTNSHIMNENGYLTQVPMTFYTQKGKWDFPPGFENGANSRFDRKIELECMSCHNGYPHMAEGSENKFDKVATGIDCERCHGPGEMHVKEKEAGHLVDISKAIDYSIVNPAKLPVALQLDVCQRCHIQGNAVLSEGKSFFDFRPGMHLSDVMNVFMPVYKGQENEHIMASHVERLKMSQCFIQTTKKTESNPDFTNQLRPYESAMTCVTCHNPHVSVKVTNNDVFNTACKKCHGGTDYNADELCSESIEKRNVVGDNCVSCHMPKNFTIDIPHVSVTDHFIRRPVSKNEVQKIKEFVTLACINNPNVSELTKGIAYLNYFEKFNNNRAWLDSAKRYILDNSVAEVTQNFRSLIRWAYLKNDFVKVTDYARQMQNILNVVSNTSYSNEDAWTCYRIGEAYYSSGDNQHAFDFFNQAVKLEPYNLEFRNKLGAVLIDLSKPEQAKAQFEFIIKENPEYPQAYCNLGFLALSAQRDFAQAEQLYNKALSLDPDYERALLNKAALCIITNRKPLAKKLLTGILKKHPDNNEAKEALARIN